MRASAGLKWVERVVKSEWYLDHYEDKTYQEYAVQITRMASVACHEKTWELIRSANGARNYVTKYAAKQYQKEVPLKFQDVGRFWGISKDARPEHEQEIDVTDDEVRSFLAERGHTAADWEVLPKILFNVKPPPEEELPA